MKIAIDVDNGARIREHLAAVGIAFLLAQDLKRCGIETIMTDFNETSDDNFELSIEDRQHLIRSTKCDYSISIHCNVYSRGKSNNESESIKIFIHRKYNKKSEKLSKKILKYLLTDTSQINNKINKAAVPMCNCSNLGTKGSIFIVFTFVVNESDAMTLMGNASHWKSLAIKICKGISDFIGIKYMEEGRIPTKNITRKSPKEDVKWLQKNLNAVLNKDSFVLEENGIFNARTRIAVLIYWEKLGWNKKGSKDGWIVGSATIDALSRRFPFNYIALK